MLPGLPVKYFTHGGYVNSEFSTEVGSGSSGFLVHFTSKQYDFFRELGVAMGATTDTVDFPLRTPDWVIWNSRPVFNVLPCFSRYNCLYASGGNPEHNPQIFAEDSPGGVQLSHFSYLTSRENRVHSPFFSGIYKVVRMGALKQVLWVYTRRVVAFVADKQGEWVFSVIQKISNPGNGLIGPSNPKSSVVRVIIYPGPRPQPTIAPRPTPRSLINKRFVPYEVTHRKFRKWPTIGFSHLMPSLHLLVRAIEVLVTSRWPVNILPQGGH